MPRFICTAYSLAGLLLLYVLHPTVAWLVLGFSLAYMFAGRRRRALHTVSLS
jgi:hypothetical protein